MVKRETVKEENEDLAISQVAANVIKSPVDEFLHENYLPYAYYVIRNRALVGVDGLKPVNRRILYSMYKQKLTPSAGYIKAQMIVGDVMGHYHPHGDSGISGGLAHMAQTFATRVPLIDNHGSVGYSTGDRAAAPRYWEARLTKAAMELLSELDDNALPISRNYDDTMDEPAILPVRWPVTIINGTEGIAVGYASNVFPSNPSEAMDAAIALLKNPDMTVDEILQIMPGPDFPTGGELIGSDGIREMYETGKGTFQVRGRYTTKQLSRGRTEISFYELPFQVSAEDVTTKIQKLKKDGKLPEITTYKDLSDRKHSVKYNITLKTGSNVTLVLKDLFSQTPLEARFTSNNTVLDEGMPVKKGIIGLFEQFIDLRKECARNRDEAQVSKYEKAIHRNEGIIKTLIDIDKAIAIIRNSETAEIAKKDLMKTFKLDDEQAEYVLSMQLRKLTKSDRNALIATNEDLTEKRNHLREVLDDNDLFVAQIIEDLEATKKIIADDRRTVILDKSVDDIKAEEKDAQVAAKAISKNKSIYLVQFADNSLYKGIELPKGKNLLPIKSITAIKADDDLFALMSTGKGVRIPSTYIPFDKIVDDSILGIEEPGDFVALGKLDSTKADRGMIVVTKRGKMTVTNGKVPVSSTEFDVLQITDDDEVTFGQWVSEKDSKQSLATVSKNGLIARTPCDGMRVTGFGSQGVRGMNVADDDEVVSAFLVSDTGKIVSMTKDSIKTTLASDVNVKNRGGKGMALHRLGKNSGWAVTAAYGGDNVIMTDMLGNQMSIPAPSARATGGFKFPTLGLILGEQKEE